MNVLIVGSSQPLAQLWKGHLERSGAHVQIASSQDAAIEQLDSHRFEIIILNLVLEDGSALAVADLAQFRQPDARIIFVTNTTFFSDGSIFNLCANACAFLPSSTSPDDLTNLVHHYAKAL